MYLVLQQFFCGAEGKWKLSGAFKLAFLSAALIAGVTHLFAFTNLLINHDSLSTMYSVADYLRSGRWAIKYVALLRGNFEITGVIAIIAVVMMALAAGFTVRCIRLQDKVSIPVCRCFLRHFSHGGLCFGLCK